MLFRSIAMAVALPLTRHVVLSSSRATSSSSLRSCRRRSFSSHFHLAPSQAPPVVHTVDGEPCSNTISGGVWLANLRKPWNIWRRDNAYGQKKIRKELGNVGFTWRQAFFALAQRKVVTNPAYRNNLIRVLMLRCEEIPIEQLAQRFFNFWGTWAAVMGLSMIAGLSCVKYWYNSDARRAELLAALCVDCGGTDPSGSGDRGWLWDLVRGFRKEFRMAASHLFPVELELMELVGGGFVTGFFL